MGTFNNNSTWGKILNIVITILTAIATTFGVQSCAYQSEIENGTDAGSESRSKIYFDYAEQQGGKDREAGLKRKTKFRFPQTKSSPLRARSKSSSPFLHFGLQGD